MDKSKNMMNSILKYRMNPLNAGQITREAPKDQLEILTSDKLKDMGVAELGSLIKNTKTKIAYLEHQILWYFHRNDF